MPRCLDCGSTRAHCMFNDTKEISMKRTIFVLVLSVACALAATAQSAPQTKGLISKQQLLSKISKPISKRQIKSLIKNAKTPEEHQQIADYYREQSIRLLAESKKHAEMRAEYTINPGKSAQIGFDHCTFMMQDLKVKSKKAADLAFEHEQMAKEAAQE